MPYMVLTVRFDLGWFPQSTRFEIKKNNNYKVTALKQNIEIGKTLKDYTSLTSHLSAEVMWPVTKSDKFSSFLN